MNRLLALIINLFILFLATAGFAQNLCAVEFFASNNTAIINLQTAYQRLTGNEQQQLQDSMIAVLQKNHIEQGKFADIIGTYRIAGKNTADNTAIFLTSPYQCFNEEKVFSLASQLANEMKQESILVFVPSLQPIIGELKVSFTTYKPTIKEMVYHIHKTLPPVYQVFSLHLTRGPTNFENAKVAEVEWLGSKINSNDLINAFPAERVTY